MKVIILCGGKGIRLDGSSDFIPKALVKVGHRPMIWHIMKIYAQYGYTEFILALGKDGDMIRNYFYNYDRQVNDTSLTLGASEVVYESRHQEQGWKITFVETGEQSGTGARIFRCMKYVEGQNFMVSYSDCLSDIYIPELVKIHEQKQKILTISGVMPPYRYGEFVMKGEKVVEYQQTSQLHSAQGSVNGGFMVCTPQLFNYLSPFNECSLESQVFTQLVKEELVHVYKHTGFWQCLDNSREYEYLNVLCEKNMEHWLFKPGSV